MRIINADGLKQRIRAIYASENGSRRYLPDAPLHITPQTIEYWIDNEPTVDAEPIRHGHWIYKELGYPLSQNFYICSECGYPHGLAIDNYCPHCGTKMNEEINENETY